MVQIIQLHLKYIAFKEGKKWRENSNNVATIKIVEMISICIYIIVVLKFILYSLSHNTHIELSKNYSLPTVYS